MEILSRGYVYYVTFWIPIIVLGKNNGLLKVEMQEDKITDITDIGYGVYPFRPNITPPYLKNLVYSENELSIVICNLKYLEEVLSNIDKGMNNLLKSVKEKLTRRPFLVISEIMRDFHNYEARNPNLWK